MINGVNASHGRHKHKDTDSHPHSWTVTTVSGDVITSWKKGEWGVMWRGGQLKQRRRWRMNTKESLSFRLVVDSCLEPWVPRLQRVQIETASAGVWFRTSRHSAPWSGSINAPSLSSRDLWSVNAACLVRFKTQEMIRVRIKHFQGWEQSLVVSVVS